MYFCIVYKDLHILTLCVYVTVSSSTVDFLKYYAAVIQNYYGFPDMCCISNSLCLHNCYSYCLKNLPTAFLSRKLLLSHQMVPTIYCVPLSPPNKIRHTVTIFPSCFMHTMNTETHCCTGRNIYIFYNTKERLLKKNCIPHCKSSA